jgi:diaminohydroxyphosphoribosylaminopyrimidine deaminase/5-amino-6-(5-phosphoribosylamino)uracil reductase
MRRSAIDPVERALSLARQALGIASPNPAVGAVLVKDGRIVGEGFTQPPGGPHAEVMAIRQAGQAARGAALYVTLEPCCHYGLTPPCTEAILAAGVREVHLSHLDPDPKVNGRGKAELESVGVVVFVGEGEEEARRTNEAYLKHRTTGLPFVIAKFAASLDGKIAVTSGDSRWVSGPEARRWAHRQRTLVDAVMVGARTVLVDDPELTARPEAGEGARQTDGEPRQPLRVVVDSRGRTPASARVLQGPTRTLLATTDASSDAWRQQMRDTGAEVVVLPARRAGGPASGERVDLGQLLRHLGGRDVLSLLVEGGGELLGAFFDLGLVDKMQAIIAPIIIGGQEAPTAVAGRGAYRMADALRLREVTVERLGEDLLVTGYVGREKGSEG